MVQTNRLALIKSKISTCIGQKVQLKINRGKRKTFTINGTLLQAHANVFVVNVDGSASIATYSYIDVLTNTVEFTVYKGDKSVKVS